jgi:hypothetical protein
MIETRCELFDACGFAVGADPAKDKDGSSAGIGKEKIAIGCGPDEPRHRECAAAESHHFLVVRSLHGSGISAGIKSDLETSGRDRPRVGGAGNYVRSIVDGLVGLRFGEVNESDLPARPGPLLIPIGECGLAGDGLLRG